MIGFKKNLDELFKTIRETLEYQLAIYMEKRMALAEQQIHFDVEKREYKAEVEKTLQERFGKTIANLESENEKLKKDFDLRVKQRVIEKFKSLKHEIDDLNKENEKLKEDLELSEELKEKYWDVISGGSKCK